jgi:hypothetical protein
MDRVGPLQEAQEAELGAGSGIASPDHGARQLLPELLPYTRTRPLGKGPTPSTKLMARERGEARKLLADLLCAGFRLCP